MDRVKAALHSSEVAKLVSAAAVGVAVGHVSSAAGVVLVVTAVVLAVIQAKAKVSG